MCPNKFSHFQTPICILKLQRALCLVVSPEHQMSAVLRGCKRSHAVILHDNIIIDTLVHDIVNLLIECQQHPGT